MRVAARHRRTEHRAALWVRRTAGVRDVRGDERRHDDRVRSRRRRGLG